MGLNFFHDKTKKVHICFIEQTDLCKINRKNKVNATKKKGKPAAQVSNKIDLRHGWNLLPKSTIYSDCSIYTLVLMLYAMDG